MSLRVYDKLTKKKFMRGFHTDKRIREFYVRLVLVIVNWTTRLFLYL